MSNGFSRRSDDRHAAAWAWYFILTLLLWSSLVGLSLWSALSSLQQSTLEVATTQGREVFRLIEAIRVWNAEHAGVYVVQTERDPPNPYLSETTRETATVTGKPLTLLNPAYMTRQISGVIEREAGIRLHLTSLKPLNPDNHANAWEAQALRAFDLRQLQEQLTIEQLDGKAMGRYIAPLLVKQSCLPCHEQQGYKPGDVRGGLSVEWSVEPLFAAMHVTRDHTITLHVAVWLLISALLVLAIRQLLCNLVTIRDSGHALAKLNVELEATVESRTRQLQDSMQTLRSVSDLAPGVIYQYRLRADGSACIPFASERIHELFGVHSAEVRDDAGPAFAHIHPDDLSGLIESTKVSARNLSRWKYEFRVLHEGGEVRWVYGDAVPLREDDGATLWSGFMSDITERKEKDAALARSEEQLRLLFENILHGVLFQNEHGAIIGANPMAEKLLGLSLDQMLGRTSLDPAWRVLREDGSVFPGDEHPAMQALRSGKPVCDVVMGVFNPGLGESRWLLVTAVPQFRAGQSLPFEVFTTFSDITERKQAEEILKRHKVIVDTAQDGFWMADVQGRLLEVNQAYSRMTGYSVEELLQMRISDLDVKEQGAQVRAHIDKVIAQGYDQFETQHRHKNGFAIDVEVSVTFMAEAQLFFVFSRNIRERKQAEQAMHDMAYYDALTRLPNRRMLSDRLAQVMAASKRTGHYGALMFLDLDNFKPLNDNFGHEVGDTLLIEVARRIKQCVREVDTVARFGGDEFVIMLSELDGQKTIAHEQARLVAEKVRQSLAESYHLSDGKQGGVIEHRCSVSIGVALFVNHESSERELLNLADKAMYTAKQAGRNRVCFFSRGDSDAQV